MTQRFVGAADQGDLVEVIVPASLADVLRDRWPRQGLTAPVIDGDRSGLSGVVVHRLAIVNDGTTRAVTALVNGVTAPGGWERIESELALFASERLAGLIAVHAAVLAVDNRVVLVPGASGIGKSTLTVAAHRAGAVVLSDEYALVDPTTGRVTGWQRPVRVRQPGGGVERLDLITPSEPLAVGAVALVHFDPAAGDDWAPIPPSECVLGLLANTVCARSRPDESLDAAIAIAIHAMCVRGTRGEADASTAALLALLR